MSEFIEVQAPKLPKIQGQQMDKLPDDLYIPPHALEVFLEAFEGPLDLLLYLIRKQNLNILDIPLLKITQQYMEYISLMSTLKLELAAEYLVMAALLAEIKSRLLLPKPVEGEEDGDDPRMTLVRRLQEYERFKTASENLDQMPRVGRDLFLAQARPERIATPAQTLPVPQIRELIEAFRDAMERAEMFTHHSIAREPLSVRERMSRILALISGGKPAAFHELCDPVEGRLGVVVCLLAVLELVKGAMADLTQEKPFAPLLIAVARARQAVVEGEGK
ncbi:MAG: ScpA family protein [Pseudomonadota bacterium]